MTAATTTAVDYEGEPSPAVEGGWTPRRWLLAAGVAAVGVAATSDVWTDLAYRATHDEEASHVLLVPIILAWLAFLRRGRARLATVRGQWVGVLLVAVGWAMHTVGDAYLMISAWQLSAPVVLVGCLVAVLGVDLFRLFGPAVFVLVFLVPLPARIRQEITLPMQNYAAVASEAVLNLVGTGVERQGNLLEINGTPVTVAEACNGLRMTHALVLVSVAFAFAAPYAAWLRVLVLLASPVFAVVCNVVRLVPTVWAYGAFESGTADVLHDLGGWVMLFLGYFVLTGFVWLLEFLGLPTLRPGGERRPAVLAGTTSLWPTLAAAGLAAGVIGERLYWGVAPVDAAPFHARVAAAEGEVPTVAGAWIGTNTEVPTQATDLLNATAILSRTYQHLTTGRRIGFLLVHVQDNRDLLGHYPPSCYPNQAWTMESAEPAEWTVDGESYRGVRYAFRPPGHPEEAPAVTILNIITAPGGHTLRDMNELEGAVVDRGRLHYGAGQFQLLFYAGEDIETQDELLAEFVRLGRPMLDAMLAEPAPTL